MVVCLETSTDDCILCTATPSNLALLISRMVYLSGPGLLSLSWKRVFWLFLHPVEPLLEIDQPPAKSTFCDNLFYRPNALPPTNNEVLVTSKVTFCY